MLNVRDKVFIKNSQGLKGVILNKVSNDYLVKTELFEKWYHESDLTLASTISKTETTTDYSIKSDLHEKICKELNSIYKAKNADYGDSFVKVRQIVPNAILVRLNDKMQRLNKLMTTDEHNVKSESIRDTLLDLANYAIMELVEMEEEK